jgi:general secretion pathway protein A
MYIGYFGFREAPFSVTPDPRFFYTNPIYQEALAALRYGIEAKKGFIVITGEAGTGKTTLLRKLMRNLEAAIHPVFIFNTHVSFTELLRTILRDLGLGKQKRDKSAMIEQLNGYLIEQAKKRHIVSLLIDEAQNLTDQTLEGLRLLSNLETDTEKLLQIVLVGQPELERKLDRPGLHQLRQRVALQCRLVPLNGREVRPYIDLRLQAAGYEGTELFDPDTVEQIALYSRGIPRLINIICDNALLIAYATSQKRISTEMVREVARDIRLGLQLEAVETEVPTDVEIKVSTDAETKVPTDAETEVLTDAKAEVPTDVETDVPTDKVPFTENKDETFATLTAEPPPYESRHRARVGVWIPLLLFVFGSATAITYTMHAKNPLSGLSFKVEEELIEERPEFFKDDTYTSLPGPIVRASEPKKAPMPAKSKPVAAPETQPQDTRFASPILRTGEPKTSTAIQFVSSPGTQSQEKWLASPISKPDDPEGIRKRTEPRAFSAEPEADLRKESLVFAEHTERGEIVSITFPAEVKSRRKRYRVREGDYLYSILRNQFGIETNDEMHDALNRVKELNVQKKNWDVLFVGEVLVFPGQLASFRR